MADRSDLAKRMKDNYENRAKHDLTRRIPVAIRVDGKAFHTFTRGFKVPFDDILISSMQETMKYMCENIQGCVLGYHQSDEITLILIDYQTLNSDAWFDYKQSKVESISASMATMAFNKFFEINANKYIDCEFYEDCTVNPITDEDRKYIDSLKRAISTKAMFDSRSFNIPKEEVANLILWRQQDATRNSIEMVGRAYFSDRDLHKVNTKGIQDLLFTQKGINWNDFPTYKKRGSCCIKENYFVDKNGIEYIYAVKENLSSRSRWIIDKDIPKFIGDSRSYIETRINIQ